MNRTLQNLLRSGLMALVVTVSGMSSALADQNDVRLNELFVQLHETESDYQAHILQRQIWSIWLVARQAGTNILMEQGVNAMGAGDHATALEKFEAIVQLEPEFAEGWNKRATVHYLMGNLAQSIEDVKKTLSLEPRHFGALSGLGLIYDSLDDLEGAKAAFEKALEANPHMHGIRLRLEEINKELENRAI